MTIRQYLILLGCGSLLAWAGFGLVLWYIDPFSAGWIGLLLFYATLFSAVFGAFGLVGFGVRRWMDYEEPPFRQVAVSFRQASLLAGMLVLALALQSQRLLTWWNLLLLVLALTLLETFFLSLRRRAV